MIKRAPLVLFLLLCSVRFAAAQQDDGGELIPNRDMPSGVRQAAEQAHAKEAGSSGPVGWILKPLDRGMFVRLPTIDTDPNRGVTYGIMPIVVLQGKTDDRIEQIHAPSLTYNKDFGVTPTYRYYYFPQDDASFDGRVSRGRYEHEAMLEYEDRSLFGSNFNVMGRFQKNRDAGQRFFGFGPDSPKSGESNYIQDYWQYQWRVGLPLVDGMPLRADLSQRYEASRILDGPLHGLPEFDLAYPEQFSDRAQQTNETRFSLDYDARDHAVTTSRGSFYEAYAEASVRGYLSEYDYERYGTDAREYLPWPNDPSKVLAVQARYEQLVGPTPPFWILPTMGGKYSLRAYGDGRYTDRGVATLNVEQRIAVYEAKAAGVTTEIQFAPFAGLGSIFDSPEAAQGKYVRPVVGAALRAVAKPQVVGSVDFGVGREGLSVFTDINYSF